jgi:hypothetical protein
MYDTTVFVEKPRWRAVQHTLIEAFVLVGIVVFVFLGNWRATTDPDPGGARRADRNLRRRCWPSVLGLNTDVAAGPGAGHRHRGRRRDRRGGSGRARFSSTESRPHAGSRRPSKAMSAGDRAPSSPSRWCCCRCSSRRPSCRALPASSTSQFAVAVSASMTDLGRQCAVAHPALVLARAYATAA